MEEKFEKVEMVREKCNVSYEKAREVLEACDYDVLEAVIKLEQEATAAQAAQEAQAAANAQAAQAAWEAQRAERAARRHEATSKVADELKGFWAACLKALRMGVDSTFVAENKGGRVFSLPLIVVILGIFVWGATLWLLVIGLFCGLRYRIEGPGEFATKASDMLDQAADFTDDIKNSVA